MKLPMFTLLFCVFLATGAAAQERNTPSPKPKLELAAPLAQHLAATLEAHTTAPEPFNALFFTELSATQFMAALERAKHPEGNTSNTATLATRSQAARVTLEPLLKNVKTVSVRSSRKSGASSHGANIYIVKLLISDNKDAQNGIRLRLIEWDNTLRVMGLED